MSSNQLQWLYLFAYRSVRLTAGSYLFNSFSLVDQVNNGLMCFLLGRSSNRTISVYDHRNVSEVLSTVEINVAPATLIPFYDEDSSVVFLSAKV